MLMLNKAGKVYFFFFLSNKRSLPVQLVPHFRITAEAV